MWSSIWPISSSESSDPEIRYTRSSIKCGPSNPNTNCHVFDWHLCLPISTTMCTFQTPLTQICVIHSTFDTQVESTAVAYSKSDVKWMSHKQSSLKCAKASSLCRRQLWSWQAAVKWYSKVAAALELGWGLVAEPSIFSFYLPAMGRAWDLNWMEIRAVPWCWAFYWRVIFTQHLNRLDLWLQVSEECNSNVQM